MLVLTATFAILLPAVSQTQPASQIDPPYQQIVATQYPFNDHHIPRQILNALQLPIAPQATDNSPWQATPHGAILHIDDTHSYLFAGQRYLPDDNVLNIVPDNSKAQTSGAWLRTQTGIAHIAFQPYTLEAKSVLFLARIQQRHNRYGYVASSRLLRPGDLSSSRMIPDDNDGLWTSMYVAFETFRYATTHAPTARHNAQTSLTALLRLTTITGLPSLPARSLMRKGDYREPGGEWHTTPDGQWDWKGDTSSDELVGHFFAYWLAWNLLPSHGHHAAIRAAVSRIAGGLIDHDLQLIGYNGQHTTWGRYGPEYLKTLDQNGRALDSLEVLSHLAVAYEITREPRFLDAYHRIATTLNYADNIAHFSTDRAPTINYSDNELAFLSFYPLLQIEKDPALLALYQQGLTNLFKRAELEKNPLWDLIDAQATTPNPATCADATDTLQRIPLSTITYTVTNSHRDDLITLPQLDDQGQHESATLIPPNERPVSKWNANPFVLDGGDNARSEDDGTFFLLPYWLGRYHHLLPCPH